MHWGTYFFSHVKRAIDTCNPADENNPWNQLRRALCKRAFPFSHALCSPIPTVSVSLLEYSGARGTVNVSVFVAACVVIIHSPHYTKTYYSPLLIECNSRDHVISASSFEHFAKTKGALYARDIITLTNFDERWTRDKSIRDTFRESFASIYHWPAFEKRRRFYSLFISSKFFYNSITFHIYYTYRNLYYCISLLVRTSNSTFITFFTQFS